jgi:hypothetical protein
VRSTARTALGLSIAAVVLGVGLTAAPAAANDGTCDSGDLCLFSDYAGQGGRWDDSEFVSDYSSGDNWWGTSTSINDRSHSAHNRYNFFNAHLCEHSWYRGTDASIPPGSWAPYLNLLGIDAMASSNYW